MLQVVQVVHQQQCNGHCLCDSVQAQQLKQQLRSAQVAGQWRGDTTLTLPLFWRRSTVSPVFFGRFPRSSLSLSRHLPTLSPSLIGHLASVDLKQHESGSVPFPPVSLQRQVVCLLLWPVFMCSSQGRAYSVSWLVGVQIKVIATSDL